MEKFREIFISAAEKMLRDVFISARLAGFEELSGLIRD